MADARVLALIDDLRRLPAETTWVEFKENNTDQNMIGKLISALSNSARIEGKDFGYVVLGGSGRRPRRSRNTVRTRFREASGSISRILAVPDVAA